LAVYLHVSSLHCTSPPVVVPAVLGPVLSGEDAALAVMVMQLCAIRLFAFTRHKKNLGSREHA
jgi:uncharacterized protein (DUF2062 family)